MNPKPALLMDRWLVHPAALAQLLAEQWLPLTGSTLMKLRLDSGAVEGDDDLASLAQRALALIAAGQPVVRLVLQDDDDAQVRTLTLALRNGSAEPAKLEAVHLYAFSTQAPDVIGSLCIPERSIQQDRDGGAHTPVAIRGRDPDAAFQQDFDAAFDEWRQISTTPDDEDEDLEGDDQPIDFDWDRAFELQPVDDQEDPGAAPADLVIALDLEHRWFLLHDALPGRAVEVRLTHAARPPKAGDDELRVCINVSEALAPLPSDLQLALSPDWLVSLPGPLEWTENAEDPAHSLAQVRVALTSDMRGALLRLRTQPLRVLPLADQAEPAKPRVVDPPPASRLVGVLRFRERAANQRPSRQAGGAQASGGPDLTWSFNGHRGGEPFEATITFDATKQDPAHVHVSMEWCPPASAPPILVLKFEREDISLRLEVPRRADGRANWIDKSRPDGKPPQCMTTRLTLADPTGALGGLLRWMKLKELEINESLAGLYVEV